MYVGWASNSLQIIYSNWVIAINFFFEKNNNGPILNDDTLIIVWRRRKKRNEKQRYREGNRKHVNRCRVLSANSINWLISLTLAKQYLYIYYYI